jgi:hypothetical protein
VHQCLYSLRWHDLEVRISIPTASWVTERSQDALKVLPQSIPRGTKWVLSQQSLLLHIVLSPRGPTLPCTSPGIGRWPLLPQIAAGGLETFRLYACFSLGVAPNFYCPLQYQNATWGVALVRFSYRVNTQQLPAFLRSLLQACGWSLKEPLTGTWFSNFIGHNNYHGSLL